MAAKLKTFKVTLDSAMEEMELQIFAREDGPNLGLTHVLQQFPQFKEGKLVSVRAAKAPKALDQRLWNLLQRTCGNINKLVVKQSGPDRWTVWFLPNFAPSREGQRMANQRANSTLTYCLQEDRAQKMKDKLTAHFGVPVVSINIGRPRREVYEEQASSADIPS